MKPQELRRRKTDALRAPEASEPQWFWGAGALESASDFLKGLPGPFFLVGEAKLLRPWRKRLSQAWIEEGLEFHVESFPEGSECHEAAATAIARAAKAKGAGCLVGLGGGKCLDSVKWAGEMAALGVLTLPTSSATCAAATQIVVEHGENGEVLGLRSLRRAPLACIADFEILSSEPERLRHAGMADTLAKYMEWAVLEEPEGEGGAAAKAAREIVLKPEASREEIWDANLRLSARASNLADAPAGAAHSFAAGISLMPESQAWIHGEWVGLGLRFQEILFEAEGSGLDAWLESLGLLRKIPFPLDDAALKAVAGRMLEPQESLSLLKDRNDLTEERVLHALDALRS